MPKPGSCDESLKTNLTKRRNRGKIPSGLSELAFLGDTLECFSRILDAVLAVVTVGGQQANHLVGPLAAGRATLLAVK